MFGLIGSVISSAAGAHSQKKTNEANLRIAQMNNEWSEKMQQKQMDYNTAQWQREAQFSREQADSANAFTEKMWNKTNEYNSAKNQAARLQQAGLNPALAMSGNNAGTASSINSAQASTPSGNSIGLPSPSTARMEATRFDFGNAASAFSQRLLQEDMQSAQIGLLNKEKEWYDLRAQNELSELIERTNNWKLKNKFQEKQNNWADMTFGADYYTKIRQGWSYEQSAQKMIKEGMLLDKDLYYYDQRVNGELSEQLSRIGLNLANKSLSLQQAEKSFSETLESFERRVGMKIDNDIKGRLRNTTIERAQQAQNMYQLGLDGFNGIVQFQKDASHAINTWFDKNIMKPTKKSWKDTRRAFGLYK